MTKAFLIRIKYSFFSEIPDNNNDRTNLKTNPVTIPTGTTPYTAFLLSDEENSSINATIGHDRITVSKDLYLKRLSILIMFCLPYKAIALY